MIRNLFLVLFLVLFTPAGLSSKSPAGSFTAADGTFLLNGEPFVVKAAEMHYPRIPREYWEHRILMCKAMGMNTICLYVFWNAHEPKPGRFDFSDNLDVAAFCRLAQKHDMWVILRPGPYVCAEWEMGGLPWWLLCRDNIALRSNDPYFVGRVEIFMKQVGKRLAPLQIARGGNILMVQVENEYGAYGTDKPYVAAVRDIVRGAGFSESLLFQCDWSSNFKRNGLEDLLWTINFGAGANVDQQFSELRKARPDAPLMCSEYWSGWFDHWGAKHETRSAEILVAGMKDMLDRSISFSLYMAHGGTSFGHWAGANSPGFVPDCTSYDYDAPINEQGAATPKYFKVRELLGAGQTLPDVPDPIPTIAFPAVTLTQTASVFENLPKPESSRDIRPMEHFDQGWGSILYRTTLKGCDIPQTLCITEVHDYALVFVDGQQIGTLSRLRHDKTIELPAVHEGAVLDILVEAMGRINFGRAIHDHKGITEKVELGAVELKDWQVYTFPTSYGYASRMKYKEVATVTGPAYYRGEFTLDDIGDTFLDMSSWKKGMVWVNGHALGRHWEIGPQQTLYLPGCWLRRGRNEVIVLDLCEPADRTVRGLHEAIIDHVRGNNAYKFRRPGQQLDLSTQTPVHIGEFAPGNGWQTVRFTSPYNARYFCLEALDAHGGDQHTSIAELEILDADGNPLPRENWKVIYADSEDLDTGNYTAANVFDKQESTYWHTERDPLPHSIVIDMQETHQVSGFSYLPRPESSRSGMIRGYKIFVSQKQFKL